MIKEAARNSSRRDGSSLDSLEPTRSSRRPRPRVSKERLSKAGNSSIRINSLSLSLGNKAIARPLFCPRRGRRLKPLPYYRIEDSSSHFQTKYVAIKNVHTLHEKGFCARTPSMVWTIRVLMMLFRYEKNPQTARMLKRTTASRL